MRNNFTSIRINYSLESSIFSRIIQLVYCCNILQILQIFLSKNLLVYADIFELLQELIKFIHVNFRI